MSGLKWLEAEKKLFRDGQTFNPHRLEWIADAEASVSTAVDVSATEALVKLSGTLRKVPVGIIGPREATEAQCALAEKLGAAFARHGLQLVCGGKNGVMEAACKGHAEFGGMPVGILPDEEWQAANPYVAIPIATGIGPARNALIARACVALVAVGGGVGTLSEMALGLQFNRLVLAMHDAPEVKGVDRYDNIDDVLERVALRLFTGK
ncbi:TIGR00725 family protein [Microvirga sp. W0021]|uniref:TIGR00725 family protein n=1 Tax=Hohaiivirga grylli TaxID=3133970 RepID=A0ABV0BL73_9HYPH